MTVEGLVSTGLVAGTAMFMGFGMIKMVESNVNALIKDGKKQRPMQPQNKQPQNKQLQRQPTKSNFFNYQHQPMKKPSNSFGYF